LSGEKLLLAITGHAGNLGVYLDKLEVMDGAIARTRRKPLNREKIGRDCVRRVKENASCGVIGQSTYPLTLLSSPLLTFIPPVHSIYCTFSCTTTREDFRHDHLISAVQRCVVDPPCLFCEQEQRIAPRRFASQGEDVLLGEAPVSVRLALALVCLSVWVLLTVKVVY
jgi:hypothetical protein